MLHQRLKYFNLYSAGVHSRCNQLVAFIKGAAKNGAKRIRVHILTDGRDVPDGSSKRFVEELEVDLAAVSADGCDAKIASGGGRMGVTMDRYEVYDLCLYVEGRNVGNAQESDKWSRLLQCLMYILTRNRVCVPCTKVAERCILSRCYPLTRDRSHRFTALHIMLYRADLGGFMCLSVTHQALVPDKMHRQSRFLRSTLNAWCSGRSAVP